MSGKVHRLDRIKNYKVLVLQSGWYVVYMYLVFPCLGLYHIPESFHGGGHIAGAGKAALC